MKISVVVLNWLDPRLAERCLRSAVRLLQGVRLELIVVENGSRAPVSRTPDLANLTRLTFPKNIGVSRGRNAAIDAASSDYVLVLDDDACVLDGLTELVEFMNRNPTVGVAGPMIVDASGRTMLTCRRFPTLLDKFSRRFQTGWGRRLLNESELREWDHREPAFVDYVIGAAQIIRSRALREVGPYDPRCFYGPEDVDLCLRMWQLGWEVAYFPGTRVLHEERRMTKSMSGLTVRHISSLARFYAKHRYLLTREGLYRRLPHREQVRLRASEGGQLACCL